MDKEMFYATFVNSRANIHQEKNIQKLKDHRLIHLKSI